MAVEAVKWLNENDISTTLHIIGIRKLDADIVSLPFVENIGFLNKNNKGDYDKLVRTIKTSHLLLLPTQAECAGIAFVEASAYGYHLLLTIQAVYQTILPMVKTGICFLLVRQVRILVER